MKKIHFMAIAAMTVVFMLVFSLKKNDTSSQEVIDIQHASIEPLTLITTNERYGFNLDSLNVIDEVIKVNENLGSILQRYHVSPATIASIAQLPSEVFNVRALKAKKPYQIFTSRDSLATALGFVYHLNPVEYVVLDFSDSLKVTRGKHPVDTLQHELGGVIEYSLYESIMEQGGSPAIVNSLFDIFAWDVDFWALQSGDQYRVVYTSHVVNDEDAGFGEVLFARIDHENNVYYAFGYDQEEGRGIEYFDEAGKSRQGVFLRAPLQYSRISSRFSHSRFHPILKRRRPHYGVDFAAPRGTPVHAIGDGTIVSAGYSGGAGHMIKVRHTNGFVSGYLHLNGYAGGIKKGVSVVQGQTIGYVGSTGLSTGPHLDFRIWKNGVPIDPLRLSKPKSGEVCKALMEDFQLIQEEMKKELDDIVVEKFISKDDVVLQEW